ncbi:MAG: asparagine synthase (glutamine-hydrolyzing) [Rhizomicrobium sp.]
MCGIAGLWDGRGTLAPEQAAAAVRRMTRAIEHRGPDGEGFYEDRDAGIHLGHRRLSIIDVSPLGRQPMLSASGRYAITYNGEIYNFRQLRAELEELGTQFRGHSDTEVFLASVERFGLREAVTRANGIFAFAIWDRSERVLTLVRDRLGVKPLYFGWAGGRFVFGSELRAIAHAPAFSGAIDRDALGWLLQRGCVPAPHAIYEGIHKLAPGGMMRIDSALAGSPASREEAVAATELYWSAARVAEEGCRTRLRSSYRDNVEHLHALLADAVALQMESDVPLGAFLSGGVDSSTVVALMQARSGRPIKTFSIGFDEREFNEAHYAAAVAKHLGTDHTELYVTAGQAREVIPRLPTIFDEPFADSSQIPTFLVSQLARRQVTVSLSGDGGDELFAGYDRYVWGRRFLWQFDRVPEAWRRGGGRSLRASPDKWAAAMTLAQPVLPQRWRVKNVRNKVDRLADVMLAQSALAVYDQLLSHWKAAETPVLGGRSAQWVWPPVVSRGITGITEQMTFADLVDYLPNDILTKVDRASMAVGLEARVPLLDHRVVELAWRLPLRAKIRHGVSKWVLREVLNKYVPRSLIERPKQGFGVPLGEWLRGPLRDWAEALLDARRLREEGFLDPEPIRNKWDAHMRGISSEHYRLWNVLMFESWLEESSARPRAGTFAPARAREQDFGAAAHAQA